MLDMGAPGALAGANRGRIAEAHAQAGHRIITENESIFKPVGPIASLIIAKGIARWITDGGAERDDRQAMLDRQSAEEPGHAV